jgi:hypothetical protein
MIDTVVRQVCGEIIQPIRDGWKWEAGGKRLRNTATDLFIGVDGDRAFKVQAELPKLLFGRAYILIKNQQELTAATDLLLKIASQVVSRLEPGPYWRVDLCSHLPVDCGELTASLRTCPHASFRQWNRRTLYYERNFQILGRRLSFTTYDPLLKQSRHKKTSNISRIEWRLNPEKIKELLFYTAADINKRGVHTLDFQACWQAFRKLMLGFHNPLRECPAKGGGLFAFLASEVEISGNYEVIERYLHAKKPKDPNRIRRAVRCLVNFDRRIDIAALVPSTGPLQDIPDLPSVMAGRGNGKGDKNPAIASRAAQEPPSAGQAKGRRLQGKEGRTEA